MVEGIDAAAVPAVLGALRFAALKHRDQRRKGPEASPYINHPIEVAEVLARVGGVKDVAVLQAAVLHDTIEDTRTTGEELEHYFGADVRRLVEEVTDNKKLPRSERKRLQVEHAPHLTARAKLIKIGDKISNLNDMILSPPAEWPFERRREYLDWADRVIAGCRGVNEALERHFDETLTEARRALGEGPGERLH
jgi:guanosine-3',5'-bis(diphosphate) 3'-pyrophosphohydrolase